LSGLSEFIAESETPVPEAQLKDGNMLQEVLMGDAVKGALEVVEAQCQAVTQTASCGKRRRCTAQARRR